MILLNSEDPMPSREIQGQEILEDVVFPILLHCSESQFYI